MIWEKLKGMNMRTKWKNRTKAIRKIRKE